jgi:hypothetical protein
MMVDRSEGQVVVAGLVDEVVVVHDEGGGDVMKAKQQPAAEARRSKQQTRTRVAAAVVAIRGLGAFLDGNALDGRAVWDWIV